MATKQKKNGKGQKSVTQMSFADIKKARQRKAMEKNVHHPEFTPSLPNIDLFPGNVRESIEVRKTRNGFLVAAAALVVAIGGVWFIQGGNIATAEENLAAASAEKTELDSKIRALTPVKSLYDTILAQEAIVTGALSTRVSSTKVLESLTSTAAAANAELDSIAIAYYGGPKVVGGGGGAAACPTSDPFTSIVVVGCINYTAAIATREEVSNFLRIVDEDPLLIDPTVSALNSGGEGSITFGGGIGIEPAALEVPITQEQIDALTAPKPEPAAETPADGAEGGEESAIE